MTALDAKVEQFVRKGYIVQSRTDTCAQLIKPKKFSFLWAFVWFCCFGVGVLVYLLYYWAKRDHSVYISGEPSDRVVTQKRRGNSTLWHLSVGSLVLLMFLGSFLCLITAIL